MKTRQRFAFYVICEFKKLRVVAAIDSLFGMLYSYFQLNFEIQHSCNLCFQYVLSNKDRVSVIKFVYLILAVDGEDNVLMVNTE